jgi:hypothetical protein
MWRLAMACLGLFGLAGCNSISVSGGTGERELRPPRAGIEVGSLYYVRESPTKEISRPANLERLCSVNLAAYGVVPKTGQQVADINLLDKLDAGGSLDGIKNDFVTLGLSGSISDYFEYKLTNVTRTDISFDEAERIYNGRALRQDCTTWRGKIGGNSWGIYQIQSISIGDVSYSRKPGFNAGADVSAKIATFEPKLKSTLKREAEIGFSGKGLVASFGPILRP